MKMLSVAMIAWAALAVGCATAQPTATATPVVNEWGATYRMFIETICADARTLARGLVSAHPQAPPGFVTASITPERIHETIITLAQTDNERLDALGYDVNKALVLLGAKDSDALEASDCQAVVDAISAYLSGCNTLEGIK